MNQTIRFTLNGKPVRLSVDGERKLLWVLRTDLGLTGTKFGCGEGFCGACTVLIDGAAVPLLPVPGERRRRENGPDHRGPGRKTGGSIRSRRPSSSTTPSNADSARRG